MKPHAFSLAAALLLTLAACSSSSSPVTIAVSPSAVPAEAHNTNVAEQKTCENFQQAPDAQITAAADSGTPPEVKLDKRYVITLPAGKDGFTGLVRYTNTLEGEWSFFTDKEVPFIARDASGIAIPVIEETNGSAFCSDVRSHRVLWLGVGPYTLEFGPTPERSFNLVVEETHPEHH